MRSTRSICGRSRRRSNGSVWEGEEMRWAPLCALAVLCALGLLVPSRGVSQEGKAKGKAKTGKLVVHLPDEKAKLTIGGAATRQKGETRRFTTPPLVPGKQYTYVLVATWRS